MTRAQLVERNCRNYELRRLAEKRAAATRGLDQRPRQSVRTIAVRSA